MMPAGTATAPALGGKRVVVVLAWSVLGGAERAALDAAIALAGLGARVDVLALTAEDGRGRAIFREHGFPWHVERVSWHGGRLAKAAQLARLTRALRRLRPDVVLSYTTRPNVLCGLIWRASGASLMVWNQQDVGGTTKFGRRLARLSTRLTPMFVANSQDAARFVVSEFGAEPGRVHTVLSRVEPIEGDATMRREWRARLAIDDDAPVVSMLAHLHPVKDHATLLRAWRSVLDAGTGTAPVLLLAGRPSGTGDSAKALAFDLDLGATVRFLGEVDVGGVLAASDIGVLTSLSESRPRAVLESAAAGLPIVASDLPGIREILGQHQLSFLVPPGDADRFASALISLLTNPALRKELGEENRRRTALDRTMPAPTIEGLVQRALAS